MDHTGLFGHESQAQGLKAELVVWKGEILPQSDKVQGSFLVEKCNCTCFEDMGSQAGMFIVKFEPPYTCSIDLQGTWCNIQPTCGSKLGPTDLEFNDRVQVSTEYSSKRKG